MKTNSHFLLKSKFCLISNVLKTRPKLLVKVCIFAVFWSLSFLINCIVSIWVKRKSSASFFCSPTWSRKVFFLGHQQTWRSFLTGSDILWRCRMKASADSPYVVAFCRFWPFLQLRSKVDVSSPSSLGFSTVTLWRSLWEKNRTGGAEGPAVESFLGRPQRPAGISNQPYSKSIAQSPTRSSAASIN